VVLDFGCWTLAKKEIGVFGALVDKRIGKLETRLFGFKQWTN